MNKIEIRKAEVIDVKEALKLAMEEYEKEADQCAELFHMKREEKEIREGVQALLEELFSGPFSYVILEEKVVKGYMGFWGPKDGFFGNVKGAFSPLGGSAFTGTNRAKLCSMTLAYAMEDMVKEGVVSFALSRYADDEEVGKSLVMNGFGIRCSDAIRELDSFRLELKNAPNICCCELEKDEFEKIKELDKGLSLHLLSSPIFYPTYLEKAFPDKKVRTGTRVFIAKDVSDEVEKIIGYFRIGDEGETIFSDLPSVMNICGTYVDPAYRNHEVAEGLLYYVAKTMKEEGATYLGVDCETLNPTALRFWGKNFQNYTYSYARRIDERVIGYDSYWNEYWDFS